MSIEENRVISCGGDRTIHEWEIADEDLVEIFSIVGHGGSIKKANCSLRLFMPFEFEPFELRPTVSMQYLEGFTLIAYQFNGEPPPKCWNKYNVENCSIRLSGGDIVEDFGAMIWDEEKKRLNYHIGIKADAAKIQKRYMYRLKRSKYGRNYQSIERKYPYNAVYRKKI